MNAQISDVRSDESLIHQAVRDPDGAVGRAAASELLRRYQRRVYLWCYRYVRERERALDLTQEVLAKAWRALPTFSFRSRFSWWLFVVTRNRCRNELRAPSLLRDDEVVLEALTSTEPGPAEAFEQRQDEEAIRRLMMDHLDEEERVALWMCCFERMPVEGITEALALTNATGARGLLQRARRKLRAALETRARESA